MAADGVKWGLGKVQSSILSLARQQLQALLGQFLQA
jgi:hypothetical protein